MNQGAAPDPTTAAPKPALATADPRWIAAQLLKAASFVKLGRLEEARSLYEQLLAGHPDCADAHNGVGAVLRAERDYSGALQSFGAALQYWPSHAAAASNYGLTLHDLGRSAEAAAHLRSALAQRPQHLSTLHNLGLVLHSIDRHEEAAGCFARLLALEPKFPYVAGNLVRARLCACDWSGHPHELATLLSAAESGSAAADPLTSLMVTGSPRLQFQCISRFAAREYPPVAPLWRGQRYRHRRIRVAYLSADFHDHPVAHLLAGVLERHDLREFETWGVSLRRSEPPGALHLRLRGAFEHFIDASGLTDTAVALKLRDLEVDIAIDLGGFTRGGRPGILASRPAPLQVNFLGFAGTFGMPYIDYIIADRVVIPTEQEAHYRERIVRMPHSFLPSDQAPSIEATLGADAAPPTRAAAGLPEDAFVFCAFSNSYKITPPFFDTWMRLLREIPRSVLWLREYSPTMRANLTREAASRGIARERLVFAPRMEPLHRHVSRYRLADLFLDTSPYGAHATAQEALRAGLPVLTCSADSMASRVAASLLTALGLPELITQDLGCYWRAACSLAKEPASLLALRRRLETALTAGSTFDPDAYRRALEEAFRLMWVRHESGQTAENLDVPPQSPHFAR